MAGNRAGKGNPASKRMGNDKLKARRVSSWVRGQQRKEQNRRENAAAAARNRELREQGLPTPWEARKLARKARRDRMRAEGLLPPIGMTRQQWEQKNKLKGKV